jgi:hypothetical protein
MIPICSFRLKPIKRKKIEDKPFNHSIGEYIARERIQRKITQVELSKHFGVKVDALSSWETNRRPIHPKRLKKALDFIGYVPDKISKIDFIGTQCKIWRLQNNVSMDMFCGMVKVPKDNIIKIETARYCKISDSLLNTLHDFLRQPVSYYLREFEYV